MLIATVPYVGKRLHLDPELNYGSGSEHANNFGSGRIRIHNSGYKDLIYTNYAPRGPTESTHYIMDALRRFLKTFKLKRPVIAVAMEWWFHLNNDPVYTAAVVTSSMAARQFQGLQQPLYTPGSCRASFFLFPHPGDLPRRIGSALWKLSHQRTPPPLSSTGKSAARRRLPATISRKAKNTKCLNWLVFSSIVWVIRKRALQLWTTRQYVN